MDNMRMNLVFVSFVCIKILACAANIASTAQNDTSNAPYVVSHISNGSIDSTYAVLKHDQLANLPSSRTICAEVMAPFMSYPTSLMFLTSLTVGVRKTSEGIVTTFNFARAPGNGTKTPHIFSHQWVKGCVALNQNLSQIQWVVDGATVFNRTIPRFAWPFIPTEIRLGGANNKVTNLNIFSGAHSIQRMEQNTKANKCSVEGDFLAWKDMQWDLHGQAAIEPNTQICNKEPVVDIYRVVFLTGPP